MWWVIYDIQQNKKRTKIAEICKNYGFFRVQKSVFIGNCSKNKIEMLATEINDVVSEEDSDYVFIIPSCEKCFSAKLIIGFIDEERLKEASFRFVGEER